MLSHITNGFIFIISSFRQSRMFYQCLQMLFLNVICQYCFLHSNNQEMQSRYVWNNHHHLVPILLAHHLAWRRAKKSVNSKDVCSMAECSPNHISRRCSGKNILLLSVTSSESKDICRPISLCSLCLWVI